MQKDQTDIVRTFVLEHFARPEVCHQYCTPDVVIHFAGGREFHGPGELVDLLTPKDLEGQEALFPPEVVVDECFCSGDRVAIRFRILFTWKVTGAVITRRELGIFHLLNDKISEGWVYFDKLSEEKQREAARATAG